MSIIHVISGISQWKVLGTNSYGNRCKGEITWDNGSRFHDHQVLLDPYAKLIGNIFPDQGESVSLVKCLGYLDEEATFD